MNEKSTIDFINSNYGTNLILCKDKFSSYDAEDSNYIVEIKNRRKYYSDKLIECLKLFKNYQSSQLKDKIFIYVVTDEKGIYIFNITKNIGVILNSNPIPFKCPKTTDFNKNSKITKYSYVLKEGLASMKKLF